MQRAAGTCNQPGCAGIPIYRGRCPAHVQWNNLSPRQRGRKLIEERDRLMRSRGTTCQRCHAPPPLQLHHLDGNPANNQPANLALLCHDCHKVETQRLRVEGGRQPTLEGMD